MATVTYGNLDSGVDMNATDVDDLFDYDFFQNPSSTLLKVFDDANDYTSFTGTGFKFAFTAGRLSGLTGGTLTGIKVVDDGVTEISVTGLKLSAEKVADAIFSGNDAAFLALLLSGNDKIDGTKFADTLVGGAGVDVLKSNAGNDKLLGGIGADDLFGGAGADRFVFKATGDSTVAASGRDTIFDFSIAENDRIDLSGIDANSATAKNDAFSFIGTKAFSGTAGEVRFEKKASDTFIYADVNGDKTADFAIHLDDAVSLIKGYFVL